MQPETTDSYNEASDTIHIDEAPRYAQVILACVIGAAALATGWFVRRHFPAHSLAEWGATFVGFIIAIPIVLVLSNTLMSIYWRLYGKRATDRKPD